MAQDYSTVFPDTKTISIPLYVMISRKVSLQDKLIYGLRRFLIEQGQPSDDDAAVGFICQCVGIGEKRVRRSLFVVENFDYGRNPTSRPKPPKKPREKKRKAGDPITKKAKEVLAESMRKQPTPAEAFLWTRLERGDGGAIFKTQVLMAGYILDFFCESKSLAVEVDGGYHKFNKASDYRRDYNLTFSRGIRTLRFTNEQVLGDVEGVIRRIRDVTVD